MCKVIDFVVEKQKRRDCKIKGEVASNEMLERFLDTALATSFANPYSMTNILGVIEGIADGITPVVMDIQGDEFKTFHIPEDCMVDEFVPNPKVVKSLGIPVINTGGDK